MQQRLHSSGVEIQPDPLDIEDLVPVLPVAVLPVALLMVAVILVTVLLVAEHLDE